MHRKRVFQRRASGIYEPSIRTDGGIVVKGWESRKKFIRMACRKAGIFQPAEGGKPPRNFSGCLLGAHIDGRGMEKSLLS